MPKITCADHMNRKVKFAVCLVALFFVIQFLLLVSHPPETQNPMLNHQIENTLAGTPPSSTKSMDTEHEEPQVASPTLTGRINLWVTDQEGKYQQAVHIFYYQWYANPEFDPALGWNHWNHKILPHWLIQLNLPNKVGTVK